MADFIVLSLLINYTVAAAYGICHLFHLFRAATDERSLVVLRFSPHATRGNQHRMASEEEFRVRHLLSEQIYLPAVLCLAISLNLRR